MNLCPLCNINTADKKNSHIIPKFLGKALFENIKPRFIYELDKSGKHRKRQDIPKQDFLICSFCEKRLGILETYVARKITSINNYTNEKSKFEIFNIGPNEILNCLKFNPLIFKLFCFSLIWRLSITSNPIFKNFKLPVELELEMSLFLNANLLPTHRELLENLKTIEKYPEYHLIAYKQKKVLREFVGVLTAFQMSEDHYGIFIGDIILLFYLNDNRIDHQTNLISNKENAMVKFVLANSIQWKKINSEIIDKRLFDGT